MEEGEDIYSAEEGEDEFASYEEAAEFWDTHDMTDFPEAFQTVEMQAELRQRHYEVEIDEDIIVVFAIPETG
jgi:hypothetical protein